MSLFDNPEQKSMHNGFILPIETYMLVSGLVLCTFWWNDEHNDWTPYHDLCLWYWFGSWKWTGEWVVLNRLSILKKLLWKLASVYPSLLSLRKYREVKRSQPLPGKSSKINSGSFLQQPFFGSLHVITDISSWWINSLIIM